MSYHCKSYYPSLYSHCRILAQEWRDRKRRRGFLCMYSKGESGIMGCVIGINGSVDKRNNPPSQCTCLFAEGIWCFCATCRCEGSSTFPSSFVFLRLFPFVLPHHLSILLSPPPSFSRACVCVCASLPFECVTAVVCLFTFSPLSTFTRLRDLHWTWPWMPHPASSFSRLSSSLLFFVCHWPLFCT